MANTEIPQAIQRWLELRSVAQAEQHKVQQAQLKAVQAAQQARQKLQSSAVVAEAKNDAAQANVASRMAGAEGALQMEPLSTDLTQGLGFPGGSSKPEAGIKLIADGAVKQGPAGASGGSVVKQVNQATQGQPGSQPALGQQPIQSIEGILAQAIQRGQQPVTSQSQTTQQQFINVPGPGGSSTTGIVPLTSRTTTTRPGMTAAEEAGLQLQGLRLQLDQASQARQEKSLAEYRRQQLDLQWATENRLQVESRARQRNVELNSQQMRSQVLLNVIDTYSTPEGGVISPGKATEIRDALLDPKAPPEKLVNALRGVVPDSQLSREAARLQMERDKTAHRKELFEFEQLKNKYESMKGSMTDWRAAPLWVFGGSINRDHPGLLTPEAKGSRKSRQGSDLRAAFSMDPDTKEAFFVPGGGATALNVQEDMWFDREFIVMPKLRGTGEMPGRGLAASAGKKLLGAFGAVIGQRQVSTYPADVALGLMYWQSQATELKSQEVPGTVWNTEQKRIIRRGQLASMALEDLGYMSRNAKGTFDPVSENVEFDIVVQRNYGLFNNYEIRAPEMLAELANSEAVLGVLDQQLQRK